MTPLNLAPGLHPGIPEGVYHGDLLCEVPTLSRSQLVTLVDKSASHLWAQHPRLGGKAEDKATKRMDFGSAAHIIALGKGAEIVSVEADNWMTKAAKEARGSARAQGKIPLLLRELDEANIAVSALHARLKFFDLLDRFTAAESEVVLIWDEGDGCRCRAMGDKLLINREAGTAEFFDLKFTESANPKDLDRHFVNMAYYVQESFYSRGLAKLLPDFAGRIDFTFIMQETEFPYAMVPVQLSGEFKAAGQAKVQRGIDLWKQCLSAGKWPGYCKETLTLHPPTWFMAKELGG